MHGAQLRLQHSAIDYFRERAPLLPYGRRQHRLTTAGQRLTALYGLYSSNGVARHYQPRRYTFG